MGLTRVKLEARGWKLKAWKGSVMGFLLLASSFQPLKAQTFAEWFSQRKTQLKYLTEQIAALEQYGSYVRQGYQISREGLGGIGNWVKGEFDLHSQYYHSLRTVNPVIGHNPKADRIVGMAQVIPGQFDQLQSLEVPDAYVRYIASVKASVLSEVDRELAELQTVLSGSVAMRDDERLKRLDVIDEQVSDQLVFTRSFCSQVRMLFNRRQLELQDIQTQKGIYEGH